MLMTLAKGGSRLAYSNMSALGPAGLAMPSSDIDVAVAVRAGGVAAMRPNVKGSERQRDCPQPSRQLCEPS